jgi:hypothetical protein
MKLAVSKAGFPPLSGNSSGVSIMAAENLRIIDNKRFPFNIFFFKVKACKESRFLLI